MISNILYQIYPYQIFNSVFFRASMGFLTAYFITSLCIPPFIVYLHKKNFISDFNSKNKVPIMGGAVMVVAILIATILWIWSNHYVIASLAILLSFSAIGFVDDLVKVINHKKINEDISKKKKYSAKTDGISGTLKIILEILVTFVILVVTIYYFSSPSLNLQIPFVPIKNWHPSLPTAVYLLLAIFIVVGCANAVNLLDGLDSLVSIPIINSLLFVSAVTYIAGDSEWSSKLKIFFISTEIKELSIFSVIIVGSCIAFLKYNSPPAYIYMGDVGSLGLGAATGILFLFTKAELFLPIIGGTFVIAAFSVIVQRVWFFILLKLKGREYASKNRFFFRAPYHHHQQVAMSSQDNGINSVYSKLLSKFWFKSKYQFYKDYSKSKIDSKVIWQNHIKAVWFMVIAFLIYFKIR